MTNEEAIMMIRAIPEHFWNALSESEKYAMDMAVKALNLRAKISILGDDVIIMPKHGTWVINGVDVHEAIEKQIPMKTNYHYERLFGHEFVAYDCPSCLLCSS